MGKIRFVWTVLVFALSLGAGRARASEKRSDVAEVVARALQKKAMEEDYLATNFSKAQESLEKALTACGTDACDVKLRAALRRDLGVVQIGGQLSRPRGQDNFVEAQRLDPGIALDHDLETKDIKAAWEAAKGRATSGGTSGDGTKKSDAGKAPSSGDTSSAPAAEPSWNAGVKLVVKDNNIAINPVGAIVGGLNITYTRALSEKLSLGISGLMVVPVLVDYFAAGGGIGGLFWLKRPNTGVSFGPYVQMFRAVPQQTTGLSMVAMAVGAELGQRWLWESGVNLGFGGGLGYSFPLAEDTCATGATCSALKTGLAPRLYLDVGYAF